jgi:hypothetical protein
VTNELATLFELKVVEIVSGAPLPGWYLCLLHGRPAVEVVALETPHPGLAGASWRGPDRISNSDLSVVARTPLD